MSGPDRDVPVPTAGGSDIEVARFVGDPADLRPPLTALWVDVTQAGGAIGFRPPVTARDVAPAVDDLLDAAAAGRSRLVVATRRPSRELVGLVAVTPGPPPRYAHRVTLERLQVHPSLQGRGVGARLVAAAHRLAGEDLGAELALVSVRDGLGLERFYERLGYACCARIPGGLAFEDGERFDELWFVATLRRPVRGP